MSRTYAMADLHGRYDLLRVAYEAIAARSGTADGTIVHLGDYVDRGPHSREIIEFLLDPCTVPGGFRRIVLRGNHEEIMLAACASPELIGWWLRNGGGATLLSYGHPITGEVDLSFVPTAHREWAEALPLTHIDEHRVFVHAGVRPGVPLGEQHKLLTKDGLPVVTWMLYPYGCEDGHEHRHVVHGHHQFVEGPLLLPGRTDLDTGAFYTGRLVVGVFDDDVPGGPVDLIEVRAG